MFPQLYLVLMRLQSLVFNMSHHIDSQFEADDLLFTNNCIQKPDLGVPPGTYNLTQPLEVAKLSKYHSLILDSVARHKASQEGYDVLCFFGGKTCLIYRYWP